LTRKSELPRAGYPFRVEFTPVISYGFYGWLAFNSDEYAGISIESLTYEEALKLSLNGKNVAVNALLDTETGAKTANITINKKIPVTLVPFCDTRPQVTQSDPPLINSGITYMRTKEIRIYFSIKLAYKDGHVFDWEDDLIRITGQALGDDAILWDDPENSFEKPVYFYSHMGNYIHIRPKGDPQLLPPENAFITVTVKQDILADNGNTMSSPVTISYRTNAEKITKAYKADNVWAIHDPASFDETGGDPAKQFFFRGSTPTDDRRLWKKNGSGDYQVTLYFSVSRSDPTIQVDTPDSILISELWYAELDGEDTGSTTPYHTPLNRKLESAERIDKSAAAGADLFYIEETRTPETTPVYKVNYTWEGNRKPDPGITRLIVQPWRDEIELIEADSWETAVAEYRFVPIVYDNSPPAGEPVNLGLRDYAEIRSNVHWYNSARSIIRMNPYFSNVKANDAGGITRGRASINKPWTMDDQAEIKWQYRLMTDNYIHGTYPSADEWFNFSDIPAELDLAGLGLGNSEIIREIQLRFKDTLENTSEWETVERFVYYTAAIYPVVTWGAAYNESSNSITVTWYTPDGMDGAEISVNDGAWVNYSGTESKTHNITNVPKINASRVREGEAVSGVLPYKILIRSYNGVVYQAEPTELKIWNVPGMSFSNTNQAIEISTQAELAALNTSGLGTANAHKQYVLVNDIDLINDSTPVAHTPIGTTANSFQGKFYGNGHKITIRAVNNTVTNIGLFGTVGGSSPALVRDLTVEYLDVSTSNNNTLFGGIAGQVNYHVDFFNLLVEGTVNATTGYTGGIAGQTASSTSYTYNVNMENIYAGLNITLTDNIYLGGILGGTGPNAGPTTYNGNVFIKNAVMPANLTHQHDGISSIYTGGILGFATRNSFLENVEISGKLTVIKTGAVSTTGGGTYTYIGGIIAYNYPNVGANEISNSKFTGIIDIPAEFTSNSNLTVGGIVGSPSGLINGIKSQIKNTWSSADIILKKSGNGNITVGGIAGGTSNTELENCWFEKGSIIADCNGNITAGSVIGNISSNSINKCYSSGAFINISNSGDYIIKAGGFAGSISSGSSLSECYANTNIHVSGGDIYAGGFVSSSSDSTISGNINISKCYATGNVSAETTESYNLYAGGFIGMINYNGTNPGSFIIENVYTTGNVNADRTIGNGNVYAGGIVGACTNTSNYEIKLQNSFAVGRVYAKSNGTGDVYAGGVAGYLNKPNTTNNFTLQNTAALGMSVTAIGMGNLYAAKIYGKISGNVTTTNNYAKDSMRIETSNNYNGTNILMSDTTAPVMAGNPVLHNNVPVLSLPSSGFITNETSDLYATLNFNINPGFPALDLEASTITYTRISEYTNPGIAWNLSAGTITNVRFSGLGYNNGDNIKFTFHLVNTFGASADYEIQFVRNRSQYPTNITADFTRTGPTLIETSYFTRYINGIYPYESGGSGLANVAMNVTSNKTIPTPTPEWNASRNTISGIKTDNLTAAGDYLRFNFNLTDNADNTSLCRISITRTASGEYSIANEIISSSDSTAGDPHGQNIVDSAFFIQSIWTNPVTPGPGLGFSTSVWDFTYLLRDGYPQLRNVGGL
jgi:hypothetical protein